MTNCNGEASAYVLGALEDHEVEPFVRHLESCAICRDEVASLQVVVDLLPMTVPSIPAPRGLKRRTMAAVNADLEVRRTASVRRPSTASRWRPFSAVASGIALAAAVAIVTLGGGSSSGGGTPTRITHATVASTVSGRAEVRVSSNHTELVVADLQPPPARHIYQVWLTRGANARPVPTNALFNVASDGSATVDVPGVTRGVRAVMVTAEPIGGSRRPTRRAIIYAPLS